jgi:hypothetical protein
MFNQKSYIMKKLLSLLVMTIFVAGFVVAQTPAANKEAKPEQKKEVKAEKKEAKAEKKEAKVEKKEATKADSAKKEAPKKVEPKAEPKK